MKHKYKYKDHDEQNKSAEYGKTSMKKNVFFRALPEAPESPEGGVKEVLLKNIGVTFR